VPGRRFRCRAEGRDDGNCSGELEHSRRVMDDGTRVRVERFYRDEILPGMELTGFFERAGNL